MTANELLALLGRAWAQLFIYPGGLSAFAAVWLIGRLHPFLARSPREAGDESRAAEAGNRSLVAGSAVPLILRIAAVVLPWLGVALLPLPATRALSRPVDAIVVLALLEWPLALTLAVELQAAYEQRWRHAARRLAAVLNGYPVLILALLLLALSGRSFEVSALAQPPDASVGLVAVALHWVGAATLILALPPILGLGPFAAAAPRDPALRIGLRLRALGIGLLAGLPLLPLASISDWLLPVPLLVLGLLLWGYDRIAERGRLRRWAVAYLILAIIQLVALSATALVALQERLA